MHVAVDSGLGHCREHWVGLCSPEIDPIIPRLTHMAYTVLQSNEVEPVLAHVVL